MSRPFDPPSIEELAALNPLASSVPQSNLEKRDTAITSLGRATVIPNASIVDSYIKGIDDYDDFVLNKHAAKTKKERQDVLVNFMRLFQNMLKLDTTDAHKCLDHLLKNIGKNYRKYSSGEIVTPIYTMSKNEIPYDCKIERFIDTLIFIISFQGNLSVGKSREFINRYRDLNLFFNGWPIAQRELLINYFTSKLN